MADETRVVLIKPGDVLLIAGVRFSDHTQAADAIEQFKKLTGIRPVVFFADDIAIDKLDDLQLLDLTARAEQRRTDAA